MLTALHCCVTRARQLVSWEHKSIHTVSGRYSGTAGDIALWTAIASITSSQLCWAALTLWQAVSCLYTANCVDATQFVQQAGMKTKDTTALKVPGRSLSRVLVEPNPV